MRISSRWIIAVALLGGACGGGQAQPPGEDDTGDASTDADAGESSGDPTGADACAGPEGCFNCPPTKAVELLNACTDASCAPFPNTAERLPLLKPDGGLPPLP